MAPDPIAFNNQWRGKELEYTFLRGYLQCESLDGKLKRFFSHLPALGFSRSSSHQGDDYFFCSECCQPTFERDPDDSSELGSARDSEARGRCTGHNSLPTIPSLFRPGSDGPTIYRPVNRERRNHISENLSTATRCNLTVLQNRQTPSPIMMMVFFLTVAVAGADF